jgi:hypothetical protein
MFTPAAALAALTLLASDPALDLAGCADPDRAPFAEIPEWAEAMACEGGDRATDDEDAGPERDGAIDGRGAAADPDGEGVEALVEDEPEGEPDDEP